MSEWQPIETAPRDGRAVVLWGQFIRAEFGGPEALVGHYDGGWMVPDTQTGGFNEAEPTHWLELPEAPE